MKMNSIIKCLILISIFINSKPIKSQKIITSRDINIENSISYEVLPVADDQIILYHNRKSEQVFEIYNKNLVLERSIRPKFYEKNIMPLSITTVDNTILFLYDFIEGDNQITKAVIFDKNIEIKDSLTISHKEKQYVNVELKTQYSNYGTVVIFSKDNSKSLLITPLHKSLRLQMLDNHNLEIIQDFILNIELSGFDFARTILSNQGEVFILGHHKVTTNIDKVSGFELIHIKNTTQSLVSKFYIENNEISDLLVDFNEDNQKMYVAGFVKEKKEKVLIGYFGFTLDTEKIPGEAAIIVKEFSQEFIDEISFKTQKKTKYFKHYELKEIVPSKDGGMVLIAEYAEKTLTKNATPYSAAYVDGFKLTTLLNCKYEEILLISIDSESKEKWKQSLFKKQDFLGDEKDFCSFFTLRQDSNFKIIYIDKVKKANFVSEYIIYPSGKYERKGLLNKENLNLKLHSAKLYGDTKMVVPSENKGTINLVVIDK